MAAVGSWGYFAFVLLTQYPTQDISWISHLDWHCTESAPLQALAQVLKSVLHSAMQAALWAPAAAEKAIKAMTSGATARDAHDFLILCAVSVRICILLE